MRRGTSNPGDLIRQVGIGEAFQYGVDIFVMLLSVESVLLDEHLTGLFHNMAHFGPQGRVTHHLADRLESFEIAEVSGDTVACIDRKHFTLNIRFKRIHIMDAIYFLKSIQKCWTMNDPFVKRFNSDLQRVFVVLSRNNPVHSCIGERNITFGFLRVCSSKNG